MKSACKKQSIKVRFNVLFIKENAEEHGIDPNGPGNKIK